MKKAFLGLLLGLAIVLAPAPAHAVIASATPVQVLLNCCNVVNYQWYELNSSLVKSIKGITIASGASTPLKIAVGAAGSELSQIIIPAGNSAAIFYPLVVSQGQRITVESYGSTGGGPSNGTSGRELDVDFFYN